MLKKRPNRRDQRTDGMQEVVCLRIRRRGDLDVSILRPGPPGPGLAPPPGLSVARVLADR